MDGRGAKEQTFETPWHAVYTWSPYGNGRMEGTATTTTAHFLWIDKVQYRAQHLPNPIRFVDFQSFFARHPFVRSFRSNPRPPISDTAYGNEYLIPSEQKRSPAGEPGFALPVGLRTHSSRKTAPVH